jgi:hypothetical protein
MYYLWDNFVAIVVFSVEFPPGAMSGGFFIPQSQLPYFLRAASFFMHFPMALHLAGLGQPGQVLKADFFAPPVFALPYIIVNLLTICV